MKYQLFDWQYTIGINMLKNAKRVVAGLNKVNQSAILAVENVTVLKPFPLFSSFQLQEFFYTEDNYLIKQPQHFDKPYELHVPEGAVRFMKIRMPTIKEIAEELKIAGEAIPDDWMKYNLHYTDSVDYIYILSGSINYIVDNQKIHLAEGDFLAQIASEHTWINDNLEPCYILCIVMGTKASNRIL